MNVPAVTTALKKFISAHSLQFHRLAIRETALLEIGALAMASEHYRLLGYSVKVENAKGGLFVTKLSSRGYPFNFSWFRCERNGEIFEIHSNLAVEGAHKDGAVYVVDVAVVNGDLAIPKTKPKTTWVRLNNADLATFAEVKKLVVYPMLLAQFVGIVHEISPVSLKKSKTRKSASGHFPPALISLGYLTTNSGKVLKGFAKRGYNICAIHNFDVHLSTIKAGGAMTSPFVALKSII